MPLAFSQNPLLTPDEFVKAASDRGLSLRVEQLVELHHRGVLVPFFQVLSRPHKGPRRYRLQQAADAALHRGGHMAEVVAAGRRRRLVDPGRRRFTPWHPSQWRRASEPAWIFYGPHQLLTLRVLHRVRREMSQTLSPDRAISYQLDRLQPEIRRRMDLGRQWAIFLSALDIRYWPVVSGAVHAPTDWYAYLPSFDVRARLSRFNASARRVAAAADVLLLQAQTVDVLGDWFELIGLAHPDTWQQLKGDARLAMDYRSSAEVLLSALDDLGRTDLSVAPPRPGRMYRLTLDERLPRTGAGLEAQLMRRGLSPFPSLLLVLEGASEMLLIPKVLEELYEGTVPTALIECVPLNTVDQSLDLFVRHSLTPRLGETRGDNLRLLDRPPTKVLVAVDPERTYATRVKVERERSKLVRQIHSMLPPDVRRRVQVTAFDSLVTIRTWGRSCWEFANFSNTELARAISDRWTFPTGVTWRKVRERVADLREKYKNPDIEVVGRPWHVNVTKVRLAHALEPTLVTKVRDHKERGTIARLPAARVADEALHLALGTHRRLVGLELNS
jgi:hypothetical protein